MSSDQENSNPNPFFRTRLNELTHSVETFGANCQSYADICSEKARKCRREHWTCGIAGMAVIIPNYMAPLSPRWKTVCSMTSLFTWYTLTFLHPHSHAVRWDKIATAHRDIGHEARTLKRNVGMCDPEREVPMKVETLEKVYQSIQDKQTDLLFRRRFTVEWISAYDD